MKYKLLIFLYLSCTFLNIFGQKPSENELISAIQAQNTEVLKAQLNSSNINDFFFSNSGNPLLKAIESNSNRSVVFLLSIGANPNQVYGHRTALMYATQKQNVKIVKELLKYGAAINARDSMGNTALMIASTGMNLNIVKILIRNGAALNFRNRKGLNARDYAVRSNNKAIAAFLKNVFEKKLPNYFDGPYISMIGHKKIKVNYLKHDSLRKRTDDYYQIFKLKTLDKKLIGFAGDKNYYHIQTKFSRPPTEISNIDKLLVIGDVHGQFDTLSLFLRKNHVVDENLRWSFGNGTVVFMGDIFDRGEKVTEALWLIYRLEREAEEKGGCVHLILGNHEMMVFNDDERYIAEKYFYLFRNLKLHYSKQFSSKTLLGKWLRSKNAFLKIDSMLFVHGGIHPNFIQYNLSLDSANILINNFLNTKKKNSFVNNPALHFILSSNGPFWYRGMVEQEEGNQITDEGVSKITNEFKVRHIIVGHTFRPEIKRFNNGKIISTDVPFYLPDGFPMEALLVEGRKFVILNTQGERKEIDFNK